MAKGKYEYWISREGLLRVEAYARDGLNDEQIAHNIGISKETFYQWKKKYPDFSDSLKRGKEVVDIEVENALLKRALGYSYKEVTKERLVDTGQKKRHHGESKLTEFEWEMAVQYFENRCCYCGSNAGSMTKDHIKPLNKNGPMSRDNVLPCCQKCNSSKKDNDMVPWFQKQSFYSAEKLKKIYDYITFISAIGNTIDKNSEELVITKVVEKEVVPDVTAQIYWLKNRKPEHWRNTRPDNLEIEKQKAEIAMLKARTDNSSDEDRAIRKQAQDTIANILDQIKPVSENDVCE